MRRSCHVGPLGAGQVATRAAWRPAWKTGRMGEVAERSNAPVLKTGDPQGSVGSNPTLSASPGNLACSSQFIVYVLHSASRGVYYKGSCADLERRLADHNAGRVRSTKGGRPWVLRHSETFGCKAEALRRERFFKTRSGYRWLKALGLA